MDVSAESLYKRCDHSLLPFETTGELPTLYEGAIGQDRALKSVEFGLEVVNRGFNIFLLGDHGTGRTSTIKAMLKERSQSETIPADWCYVYNFKNPDMPSAITLPLGQATVFQKDMEELVAALKVEIPKVFDSKDYDKQKSKILGDLQKSQKVLFEELEREAQAKGFVLKRTSSGLYVSPLKKSGEPLTEAEFAELDESSRLKLEEMGRVLQEKLADLMRVVRNGEKKIRDDLRQLERLTALSIVGPAMDELKEKYHSDKIRTYLDHAQEDILDNIHEFNPQEEDRQNPFFPFVKASKGESATTRYIVNVIVNNGENACAPCVFETNPTYYNLFGRIEYKFQYAVAMTDFTMIKAGALHRANGGYLVIEAMDLLRNMFSYDSLKKALRNEEIKMDDIWEQYRPLSSTALKPEAIPLKVKVVLIGTPELYYLLYNLDDEFKELFKVKADFEHRIERSAQSVAKYSRFIAAKCKEAGLYPLDRSGVARVVEHGAKLAEHQDKLSTKFSAIADLLREAHYWARKKGKTLIDEESVEQALQEKIHRHGRMEEIMQEAMQEGTTIIETSGLKVGQINGLAVLGLGDHSFGKPSRITASTYTGKAGVVNIEREIKMSGKIHDKATLIISNYLGAKYAKKTPISLSASITFEQLYGMVEGDSATCAELYALLSSIAGIPLKQSVAVTGSMDQNGTVQPVGGINEKIEGFYDLCNIRGLDGTHQVIIPARNLINLMVKKEVVRSVRQGMFAIHAISHVDEGLEILTGKQAGVLQEDGASYPEGTVGFLVDKRLHEIRESMKADVDKNRKFEE